MESTAQQPGVGRVPQLLAVLGLGYPVLAHIAVERSNNLLITASFGMLILIALLPGLLARKPRAWAMLLVVSVCLYAVVSHGQALTLLFLPPVLINTYLACLFGRTLQSGRTSLIERIVRALEPASVKIDSGVIDYARRLTQFWTRLFIVFAIINAVLALLAAPGGLLLSFGVATPVTVPLSAWSMFANVLNYLIVAVVFAVEFHLRQRRFPDQPFNGFFDFVRKLLSIRDIFSPQRRT